MNRGFIDECEREALHLSGSIQPYGLMLVADPRHRICCISENFSDLTGLSTGFLLASTLEQFCELNHQSLSEPAFEPGSRKYFNAWMTWKGRTFDLVLIRGADLCLILEFFPEQKSRCSKKPPEMPDHFCHETELQDYQSELVDYLADESGLERVMYYQFLPGGDGQVTAESLSPTVWGAFYGHRFPASDIPEVARKLYILNPWRAISHIRKEDIPLIGTDLPDLTFSDLRSVSPVHKAYMSNMGNNTSVSFPVVCHGHLEALITGHDRRDRCLSQQDLQHLSGVVRRYAQRLADYKTQLNNTLSEKDNLLKKRLMACIHPGQLQTHWENIAGLLCDHFDAQGAVCLYQDQVLMYGLYPEAAWLQHIHRAFLDSGKNILLSDHAGQLFSSDTPDSGDIAGVAAFRFPGGKPHCLYLLKGEYVRDLVWGGNPDKPVEREGDLPITPRKSFASWIEKQRGFSSPWPVNCHDRLAMFRVMFGTFTV